jgi:F-type H+-transporting ATPase subunit delta
MSGRLVVKRYARVLFECHEESGNIDKLKKDIGLIEKIFTDVPEVKKFCLASHSNIKDEIDFLMTVFIPYLDELTVRLLKIAVKNRRLQAIPFLPAAVNELLEKKGGAVSVLMETANNHDNQVLSTAKTKIMERIGREINLNVNIIPEILGGFRIFWQNKLIDMSVAGRLKYIRRNLKQDEI